MSNVVLLIKAVTGKAACRERRLMISCSAVSAIVNVKIVERLSRSVILTTIALISAVGEKLSARIVM